MRSSVGGWLAESNLPYHETNPLLIPGKHHTATLLIRHHHEAVQHQGRHFTEGAVRTSGSWIVGAKRSISSVIHKCVTCRKLRGKTEQQIMADFTAERLQPDLSPGTLVTNLSFTCTASPVQASNTAKIAPYLGLSQWECCFSFHSFVIVSNSQASPTQKKIKQFTEDL